MFDYKISKIERNALSQKNRNQSPKISRMNSTVINSSKRSKIIDKYLREDSVNSFNADIAERNSNLNADISVNSSKNDGLIYSLHCMRNPSHSLNNFSYNGKQSRRFINPKSNYVDIDYEYDNDMNLYFPNKKNTNNRSQVKTFNGESLKKGKNVSFSKNERKFKYFKNTIFKESTKIPKSRPDRAIASNIEYTESNNVSDLFDRRKDRNEINLSNRLKHTMNKLKGRVSQLEHVIKKNNNNISDKNYKFSKILNKTGDSIFIKNKLL